MSTFNEGISQEVANSETMESVETNIISTFTNEDGLKPWEIEGNEFLRDFVFFDFEANGTNPTTAEPLEFAGIHVVEGKVVGTENFLIYQDIIIDPNVVDITGITTEEMRENGIPENIAVRRIHDFFKQRLIVAHNLSYDLQMLNEFYKRHHRKEPISNPIIDTLTVARNVDFYPHKLGDLCERHNVSLTGAHRALNDVIGGAGLLLFYATKYNMRGYVNKLGYLAKYDPPAWHPNYCQLIGQKNRYNR